MTPPITHDAARVIARELLHAEYYRRAPGGDAASALFRYIAQAEIVEKERDELKAKLFFLVICDECKKPVEATDACRCFDGPWRTAERVPGTFHQQCCEPARVKFAAARDNTRLAAVVREHGAALVRAGYFSEVCCRGTPDRHIGDEALRAAKALEEALK
jgi:hypothetical protein